MKSIILICLSFILVTNSFGQVNQIKQAADDARNTTGSSSNNNSSNSSSSNSSNNSEESYSHSENNGNAMEKTEQVLGCIGNIFQLFFTVIDIANDNAERRAAEAYSQQQQSQQNSNINAPENTAIEPIDTTPVIRTVETKQITDEGIIEIDSTSAKINLDTIPSYDYAEIQQKEEQLNSEYDNKTQGDKIFLSLDERKKLPSFFSLDIMPSFSHNFEYNNYNLLPQLRLNLGMISSEIKYNQLIQLDSLDGYKTICWEILQLNLIQLEQFNLHAGIGIYIEDYTNSNDFLWGIGCEFSPANSRFSFSALGRFAYMDKSGNEEEESKKIQTYSEVNGLVNYTIKDFKHLRFGVFGGFFFQNFYQQIEFTSLHLGLRFSIH